ncbi:MAG: GAF domain-containing protein, partial [Acidobacteriota bacterium]
MSDPTPHAEAAPATDTDLVDGAVALLLGFRGEGLHGATASAVSSRGLPNPVRVVESLDEVDRWMAKRTVCLLAVGPGAAALETLRFLQELPERHSFQRPTLVLISDIELREKVTEPSPEAVALFDLTQEDRIFFWSRFAPPEHELAGLLVSAVDHFRRQLLLDFAAAPKVKDPRAIALRKLLTVAEAAGRAGDLASLQEPVLEAADELVGIESGRLWLYDSVLHTLTPLDTPEEESSAVAGLTSFAVRSGIPVRCPDSARDPRYDVDVDGRPGRFLALPIGGPEDRITGALTARRNAEEAPFDDGEQRLLERLALYLTPVFGVRAPQPLETVLALQKDGIGYRLFREEAVEAHARGFAEKGKLLRTEPGWSKWTWRTLVSGF